MYVLSASHNCDSSLRLKSEHSAFPKLKNLVKKTDLENICKKMNKKYFFSLENIELLQFSKSTRFQTLELSWIYKEVLGSNVIWQVTLDTFFSQKPCASLVSARLWKQ